MGIACRHAAACGRLDSVSGENFDFADEHRAFGESEEACGEPRGRRHGGAGEEHRGEAE